MKPRQTQEKIFFLILEMKNVVSKFKNSTVTKISSLVTARERMGKLKEGTVEFTQNAARGTKTNKYERLAKMADGVSEEDEGNGQEVFLYSFLFLTPCSQFQQSLLTKP
jgi:hypothetical protein